MCAQKSSVGRKVKWMGCWERGVSWRLHSTPCPEEQTVFWGLLSFVCYGIENLTPTLDALQVILQGQMVCRMEHFSYTPRVALAHLLCGKCGEVLWGPLAFTKPWTVFMVWVIIQQGLENDQFRNPCSPQWSQNQSNPYHFTRLSVNDVKLPMKC